MELTNKSDKVHKRVNKHYLFIILSESIIQKEKKVEKFITDKN